MNIVIIGGGISGLTTTHLLCGEHEITLFEAGGVFTPLQHLFPRPFSPPWMICLWLNFAATLNVSMAWLRGRYLLAALFGAVGGPLAYYSGAELGATEARRQRPGCCCWRLVGGS